ncbi:hypothetical protein [Streptomyces sp. BE147]|uniref:hypothetical protein n=1 Tax=unclassified Streptomyces TaxID=2593676 RepID=UPI002E78EC9F|nr:hypothetical protein [Streptomyces sp. BE147]MEE1739751.1 hypothetical protein [Streptomyces sp. BE147]
MQLDEEGRASSIPEILEQFPGREWSWALEAFEYWGELPTVRLYPSGCTTTQPVEAGDVPFFVVVDGDLTSTAPVDLVTCDYTPGLVIVTGSLHAPLLYFANNIRVFVGGDVRVSGACLGQHGDRNAMLAVAGELHARALILGSYAEVCADGGIRALVYAHGWEQLSPDIVNDGLGDDSPFFRPELLDHHENHPRRLSVTAAVKAAFAGEELFLPGVEERFPERLVLRRDSA